MRSKPPVVMLLDPARRFRFGFDSDLSQRGFEVRTATNEGAAVLAAIRGEIDAIVAGQDGAAADFAEFVDEIRKWDNTTAITIVAELEPGAIDQNWRTRVVHPGNSADLPERLLAALRASSPRIDRWMTWRPWNAPALVIQDEEPLARAFEKVLGREGFEVQVADIGEFGIEMAITYRHSVIVLDDGLPDMSGFTVLKHIRSRTPETPIFWFSTITHVTGDRALAEGADQLIQWPPDWKDVAQRIRAAAATGRRIAA